MNLTEVIRGPLLTEKTTALQEDGRTYCFEVAREATKTDIRRAVEKLLERKVESVRTAVVLGKVKRQGRFAGRRPNWKKAFVTLKEGEKAFEFFEGV